LRGMARLARSTAPEPMIYCARARRLDLTCGRHVGNGAPRAQFGARALSPSWGTATVSEHMFERATLDDRSGE
jgi:hypothetical protein